MNHADDQLWAPRLNRRRRLGRAFGAACGVMSFVGLAFLAVLITRVVLDGWSWFTWTFLTNFPSQLDPANAGIRSALFGTVWLLVITSITAIPVGVAAAVYLQEYAPNNRLTRLIHLNIANLAGVPSIVYGILGLAVFARTLGLGRSVLAGGLTLSLLVLPVIIIASREALLAVPQSFRHAAYALGATPWQTIWSHVLPAALPGILTGVILSLSRAIGEAAPLLLLGAFTYIRFVPQGLGDPFTALPIQIYAWCDQPQAEFQSLAAAGIMVLLGTLIPMNGVAIAVRAWHQRRRAW